MSDPSDPDLFLFSFCQVVERMVGITTIVSSREHCRISQDRAWNKPGRAAQVHVAAVALMDSSMDQPCVELVDII